MNIYCALTGLTLKHISFRWASPIANIIRPFRAEKICVLFHRAAPCANILCLFRAEKFNILFHRAAPCANILCPFRAEKFNILIVLQLNLSQFFNLNL